MPVSAYWFKPKRYGYGATPVTWQGWAVTLATLIIVLTTSLLMPILARNDIRPVAAFILIDIAAIVSLVIVSRRKTEGEWRWRWGGRNRDSE